MEERRNSVERINERGAFSVERGEKRAAYSGYVFFLYAIRSTLHAIKKGQGMEVGFYK